MNTFGGHFIFIESVIVIVRKIVIRFIHSPLSPFFLVRRFNSDFNLIESSVYQF